MNAGKFRPTIDKSPFFSFFMFFVLGIAAVAGTLWLISTASDAWTLSSDGVLSSGKVQFLKTENRKTRTFPRVVYENISVAVIGYQQGRTIKVDAEPYGVNSLGSEVPLYFSKNNPDVAMVIKSQQIANVAKPSFWFLFTNKEGGVGTSFAVALTLFWWVATYFSIKSYILSMRSTAEARRTGKIVAESTAWRSEKRRQLKWWLWYSIFTAIVSAVYLLMPDVPLKMSALFYCSTIFWVFWGAMVGLDIMRNDIK